MKKVLKALAIIGCVLVGLVVIFLIYSFINNYKTLNNPRYKDDYYEAFTTNAALESKYSKKGSYEVSKIVSKSDNKSIKNIRIWYPNELKDSQNVCPLIVVVNGSQCPAKVYEPFFAKLASWGFIVVGNDDPQPGTGATTSETLDFVLNQSEIKDYIDTANIGIVGYSQGGAGAINAVTEYDNSTLYKTMFTGSAAYPLLAINMGWEYDDTKINIPYFMTAGTGSSDDMGVADINKEYGGVAPLASLVDIYNHMSPDVLKVRGRVTGAEHEDMLLETESYMTAWMLYQLKNDMDAQKIFIGNDAEILTNNRWQDVENIESLIV